MSTAKPFDYTHLTVAERILLAQELLESVFPRAQNLPLTPAQRQEVENRWAAYEAGRMSAAPWDEVRSRLFDQ